MSLSFFNLCAMALIALIQESSKLYGKVSAGLSRLTNRAKRQTNGDR
jgi:hypothetical protein